VSRVVALIDGEHHPSVVRDALATLGERDEVAAAVFVGGSEKVGAIAEDLYGVTLVRGEDMDSSLREALERFAPDAVVDLSDEPVVTAPDRFRLAGVALGLGVAYRGADFAFTPQERATVATPTLAIVGTGKRVGKTALTGFLARRLTSAGKRIAVLAMGRGGPGVPVLVRGDEVLLTTAGLLEIAAAGAHAASDCYEDALTSRVPVVGCRRCGGGLAGATFIDDVAQGAALADTLGADLLLIEGSGAAVPPVRADATLLVVSAAAGVSYVCDHFGPYRLASADALIIAGAERPNATEAEVAAIVEAVQRLRPGLPWSAVTFRPRPLADVSGARVFFATTAPAEVAVSLARHLESESGCTVVAISPHLADRDALRSDLAEAEGRFDVLLTELKAAAVDVVVAAGATAGVPTVFCDNEPVTVSGLDLGASLDEVVALALRRGAGRGAA